MSGTTQSGTPITALKVATAVAATDNVLGVVKNTDGTQEAQQVPVEVIGAAVSEAAGIPAAVQAAQNAATTAQAASDASYKNATQAVNDKIGVADGAAQLDSKAQLLLQGESSLAITPATAASGTTPATPAKLKPLLPLDETATVGNDDTTLGETVSQAAGAVQSDGGDASKTLVRAPAATTARTLSTRANDVLSVQDFGAGAATTTDTAAIIAVDAACVSMGLREIRVAPGSKITGDGSTNLAHANSHILIGDGKFSGLPRSGIHGSYLPTAHIPPDQTIKPHQLPRMYSQAQATGKLKVLFITDSIPSIAGAQACPAGGVVQWFIAALKRNNPNTEIDYLNLGIGGTTWSNLWYDQTQVPPWIDNPKKLTWKKRGADYNPDVIVFWFGGNDAIGELDAVAMQNTLAWFGNTSQSGMDHRPDVILCTTYRPSIGSDVLNYDTLAMQNSVAAVADYTRSYAVANDIAYLDFMRWYSMTVLGFDPRVTALTRVQPAAATTFPEQLAVVATTGPDNAYKFPNAKALNGVNASACTDWFFQADTDVSVGNFNVMFSNRGSESNFPTENKLWVLFGSDSITCTYSDGVNQNLKKVAYPVAAPSGPISFYVMKKDNRVQVAVRFPMSGDPNPSDNDLKLGMGYVVIYDEYLTMLGGQTQPIFYFSKPVNLTIRNIAVADNTMIYASGHQDSVARFRPIITDNEIYAENTYDAGGSGAYHANDYGYRLLIEPVVESQWALCVPQTQKFAGVNAQQAVTMWGSSSPASQPAITGTKPTDAIMQQILAVLEAYGIAKNQTA